jgi:hypothetical protein
MSYCSEKEEVFEQKSSDTTFHDFIHLNLLDYWETHCGENQVCVTFDDFINMHDFANIVATHMVRICGNVTRVVRNLFTIDKIFQ